MNDPKELPRAPGVDGTSTSDDGSKAVPEIQVASFNATVWGTVARLVPVLTVALLCLLAMVLLLLLRAAPSGMVAAVSEGRLQFAPTGMWSPAMWWSVAAMVLAAVLFLTWALGYATVVAAAVAVGRDIGAGTAAVLALRALRRLVWPVGFLVALVASLTVVNWLLAAGAAAVLVWSLHPLWPMAVLTRSPRPRIGEAVAISRSQGPQAAFAMAVLGLAYWLWNDPAPREHFGVAAGFVWAVGWAALIAVTGAVLAWGLVRHLRRPTATAAVYQAATWLTEVTRPRSAAPGRQVAVAAVSVTVALGLTMGLALTPVSTRQADPAGRGPSWTVLLPDWAWPGGSDGLGAVTAGDLLVLAVNHANPPGVVVYDRDGTRRWSYRYRGENFNGLRFWLIDEAVVLYSVRQDEFRVLDLQTGRMRVSIPARIGGWSMVTERTLVVADRLSEWHCEHPVAFDLRTGKQRWERTDRCLLGLPDRRREGLWTTEWWGGMAQFATARSASVVWARITPDSVVGRPRYGTVLDLETGEDLVPPYRVPTEVYQARILSDTLYLDLSDPRWTRRCEEDRPATIQARDLRTGVLRWAAEVGQRNVDRGGVPTCHPGLLEVTPEGLLAETPREGLQLIDLATGQPRWTTRDVGSPVAMAGGTLIVENEGSRHVGFASAKPAASYAALDVRTGETLWTTRCVGYEARVTPRWFVCRRTEPIGDGFAAERFWVSDLRSGQLRWATRGIPLWAGDGNARVVNAGDGWLMAYRVEQDEAGRFKRRLLMYD